MMNDEKPRHDDKRPTDAAFLKRGATMVLKLKLSHGFGSARYQIANENLLERF